MKTILKIILASILFTFISYIFYKIDFTKVHSLWDLLKTGFPDTIKTALNNEYLNKIPKAPLFVFWAIIGTLAYLIYHSLDRIYNNVWNWTVIKLYFVKATNVEGFDTAHYIKRILTHLGIILSYLVFIILIVVLVIPLSTYIYKNANYFNQFSTIIEYQDLIIKTILVFGLWTLFFSLFVSLFKFVHNRMVAEDIIEEHELGIEH